MGPALCWDDGGKIIAVWRTLQDHADAIEADLARYYHLRLSQLGTRDLTWRHLYVLIEQLPAESALHREMAGEDFPWTMQNHLLATIADLLAGANWQRGGDANAKRPKRIERPGVAAEPVRRIGDGAFSPAEIDVLLATYREGG